MADAPNPDPGSGHEHLFAPVDVDRARLELRRPMNAQPLRAPCVLCGAVLDLTATVPVERPAPRTRRVAPDRSDGPPSWGAGVTVEPS